MLYFSRTEVSGGTVVNKTSQSKKCNICHYWYFLDKGFAFQTDPHNGCHDLLMMSMNLSDSIEKVLVSNKTSSGEKDYKYFIGSWYNDYRVNKVKPLHIMLPKTSTYVKTYDRQTKWMHFLI